MLLAHRTRRSRKPSQFVSSGIADGHVQEGVGRKPRRDRHPRIPGRIRTRREHRGRLPVRGPQLRAPGQGRREPIRSASGGTRCRAYLSMSTRSSARLGQRGADAIYPGYGFLSENPDLASACADGGNRVHRPVRRGIGTGRQQGTRHRRARAAGVPVLASVSAVSRASTNCSLRQRRWSFPLFVKAVAGGGGRGMRRVASARSLRRGHRSRRCGRPSRRSVTRPCSSSRL